MRQTLACDIKILNLINSFMSMWKTRGLFKSTPIHTKHPKSIPIKWEKDQEVCPMSLENPNKKHPFIRHNATSPSIEWPLSSHFSWSYGQLKNNPNTRVVETMWIWESAKLCWYVSRNNCSKIDARTLNVEENRITISISCQNFSHTRSGRHVLTDECIQLSLQD